MGKELGCFSNQEISPFQEKIRKKASLELSSQSLTQFSAGEQTLQ